MWGADSESASEKRVRMVCVVVHDEHERTKDREWGLSERDDAEDRPTLKL